MTRWKAVWPAALAGLVALTLAAAPAAASDDRQRRHEVQVEKIVHQCEGEECAEAGQHRRVIVIDGDGEAHRIGAHAFAMLGHHGKGGFLGVATTELTAELRRHFGVPEEAGVLVARVVNDSAAARAGVQVGDILTAVDGEAIEGAGDLLHAVSRLEPGTAVTLELWRDGIVQTLGATLDERQPLGGHAMVMRCGDGEECPKIAALGELGCGGESPCEIRVECEQADCTCTVNGDSTECETLPGFEAPGD